ncbi:hypothetical protein F4824DRAFT_450097 [Ustulina deusta]|nr:hypothetical protein F4824DRAFT_450097 [Ustulina deusta]
MMNVRISSPNMFLDIDTFESLMLHLLNGRKLVRADGYGRVPAMKSTAVPGKHVPISPLAAAYGDDGYDRGNAGVELRDC